jgi:hypothetical protein
MTRSASGLARYILSVVVGDVNLKYLLAGLMTWHAKKSEPDCLRHCVHWQVPDCQTQMGVSQQVTGVIGGRSYNRTGDDRWGN